MAEQIVETNLSSFNQTDTNITDIHVFLDIKDGVNHPVPRTLNVWEEYMTSWIIFGCVIFACLILLFLLQFLKSDSSNLDDMTTQVSEEIAMEAIDEKFEPDSEEIIDVHLVEEIHGNEQNDSQLQNKLQDFTEEDEITYMRFNEEL